MIYVDLRLSDEKFFQPARTFDKTSTHGLRELIIQGIEPPKSNGFHQGILLAQYIYALFPELERLGAFDDLDENQKEYWATIEGAVKWYQECKKRTVKPTLN